MTPLEQPILNTERLLLRPFEMDDAPRIAALLNTPEIYRTTLVIPYPYEPHMAEEWIGTHAARREEGRVLSYALVEPQRQGLIGAMGLHIEAAHHSAEVGYWLGTPFWGQGYAAEALRAVIALAFGTLQLNRIEAAHFPHNPASGRVMQKAGMQYEGTLRGRYRKGDHFEDGVMYAILREDWTPPA